MSAPKAKATIAPPAPGVAFGPGDRFGSPRFLFLGAVLLTLLVFGAFINGIKGPYIFDDADSILNNTSIRSFKTALMPPMQNGITVSGRPVLNFSFAINYLFCETRNEGVHLGNILIHALAALAFWGVVRRTLTMPALTGRFAHNATWLAWFAAALWAVHPLQTESVTYAVQRAESLVGLFYLFTLYCFIRYTKTRSSIWFLSSATVCLLGMGTKEVMATAPFIIFLYDRTFVSGSFKKAWQQHRWLHLVHAATLLLLAALVIATKSRGGSVGTDDTVTRWGYLCTQAYAAVHYVQLSVWPAGLALDYGTLVVRDMLTIVSCGLIVIGAMVATGWTLVRRPASGFLAAWFFAVLAPSSSFIPVNTQTVAEHRVYLALGAIVVAAAVLTCKFLGRRSWIPLGLLIVPIATATVARNRFYLNEVTIWEDTVAKRPENYRAWVSLGAYRLHKEKNPAAAEKDFERALALKPNHKEGLNCLGQTWVKLGRHAEGLALIVQSLQIDPENPGLNAGAGGAYMDAGRYEQALPHFTKALEPNPTNSTINYNLANCLMKLGRDAEAERRFRVAIEGSPDDIDALNNLGTLLRRNGRIDEAIGFFSRAIELFPGSAKAHNNLGVAFMMQRKTDDGLKHLREARRLEPESYETRSNLAQALTHTGQIDEAIPLCEQLLKEKPDAELANNLGVLYGQLGQLDKAEQAFHTALKVDPNHASARENYEKLRAYLDARHQQ
ncbi:MAG: tetratricopeptide repeat protein [Nibricoccus sp.]